MKGFAATAECNSPMTVASPYQHQPRRAIAHAVAAFFLLSSTDALVKSLVVDYDSVQVAFFRYAITLAVVVAFGVRTHGFVRMIRTRRPIEHLARGIFTTLELIAFYVALGHLALPTTVSMVMISPIVITVLGIVFLAEKMRPSGWISVGLGFVGMLLVVQPTSGVNSLEGTIAAMISVALWSTAQLMGRRLSTTETASTILFYYAVVGVAMLSIVAPFFWKAPDGWALAKLFSVGTIGAVGQYCLLQAFRYGRMSTLAPFEYSALVWASVFGWIFWGEVLNTVAIAGVALIVIACLHISRLAHH
jgi:drug/metabolite transporter (DMT)-like permease